MKTILMAALLAALPALATAQTAPAAPPRSAGLKIIAANLGTAYPNALYNSVGGQTVGGPDSFYGQIWWAVPFTPKTSLTLHEADVAVSNSGGSTADMAISIFADKQGLPGATLWSATATAPLGGQCCALATATDTAGVPLTAGTSYWLGVTTLSNNTNFTGLWSANIVNQAHRKLIALNQGNGWVLNRIAPQVAFGLYGD